MPKDRKLNPPGSVIYLLGLKEIMSSQAIAGMRFGEGCTACYFEDDTNGGYWALSPKQQVVLVREPGKEQSPLLIPVDNVVVDKGTDWHLITLYSLYYNVDGVTKHGIENHKQYSFIVGLQPSGASLKDLPSVLWVDFLDRNAMIGEGVDSAQCIEVTKEAAQDPAVNVFALYFATTRDHEVLWGDESEIIISFPVASFPVAKGPYGYGALAKPDDFTRIKVHLAPQEDGTSDDYNVIFKPDARQPRWIINKKKKVPKGYSITCLVDFENVVTTLETGFCDMLVRIRNFPGYRDTQYRLKLYKFSDPELLELEAAGYDDMSAKGYVHCCWANVNQMWIYTDDNTRLAWVHQNYYYNDQLSLSPGQEIRVEMQPCYNGDTNQDVPYYKTKTTIKKLG